MYVYDEDERDIYTLCYEAVTSRCNIFLRKHISHLPLLAAGRPMRKDLQPSWIILMNFLCGRSARSLRGLQLYGSCPEILGHLYTAHTDRNHMFHIFVQLRDATDLLDHVTANSIVAQFSRKRTHDFLRYELLYDNTNFQNLLRLVLIKTKNACCLHFRHSCQVHRIDAHDH